jgi:16S rRNA (adenine1518-N6/adenine1519-N6)-dimethyltransferase
MNLTDPQELKALLKKYRLGAKKRLGQHFLIDRTVLEQMIVTAEVNENDLIVEIGCGHGVLTCELLPRARRVIGVEIDDTILPVLRETTHFFRDRFDLRHEHILGFQMPTDPYKVVANIPYQLSSPILRKFLVEAADGERPTSMTLLVQKEVAEKVCNKKQKSILSLFVAAFGEAQIISIVPENAFSPPPKVKSAVLHIDVFAKPKITMDPQLLFKVIKMGFNQPRKKLKNNLDAELITAAGVSPDQRPGELELDDWERLAAAFIGSVKNEKTPCHPEFVEG